MIIDPTSFATSGTEWQVAPVEAPAAPAEAGKGFGGMLTDSIKSLEATQNDAAQASQDLATGQASDPEAVVMAVERARLSMQLASTLRTKAVEAFSDVFHTQV